MTELTKGANTPVGAERITVELRRSGGPVDLSALLIGADGKVGSDADMVFFNQPSAGAGSVRHTTATSGGPERIIVEPAALAASVHRVVLVGSCDPDDPGRTFAEVTELAVRAVPEGGEPVLFPVPPMTDGERAAVLLEIYRRGPGWRIRAVGQGYREGLAGVATDFGVEVAEEPPPAPVPVPAPVWAPVPAAAPAMSLVKPPLGRISLDKGARASISMDKQDRELAIEAALEWDGGDENRRKRGADLDLYALFVPASRAVRGVKAAGTLVKSGHTPQGEAVRPENGEVHSGEQPTGAVDRANVVYYKNLGSLREKPYIQLDGDSKVPGREAIRISRPDEQGYILLCAYSAVSNGFGSFRSFGAKAVISDGRGSTVTVPLFENTKTRYWVALALLDFTTDDGATVRHIESYSRRMNERRPLLHIDGTIEMNAGPVEFKRP
ncbi:TerD family protein [Streptomyces sp. NPDC056500]|uniref:TerD family protein n=1 Tax=Streptomyces sp. NPDC056500 TaxID=3345840 RepID=UPI00368EF3C9